MMIKMMTTNIRYIECTIQCNEVVCATHASSTSSLWFFCGQIYKSIYIRLSEYRMEVETSIMFLVNVQLVFCIKL